MRFFARWGTTVLGGLALASIPVLVALGLFVSPPDVLQGDAVRLMYLHVPAAWTAYLAFGVTALGSALYLLPRTRSLTWDTVAGASAELGVLFTGLTLALGSLWGAPVWGVWWTWDARIVSTAVIGSEPTIMLTGPGPACHKALKKAGLTNLRVDLSAADAAFGGALDAALLFQNSAARAGITLNVVREPDDGYWDNVWLKKDFVASYWLGRPTVDWFLTYAYSADSTQNETFWTNPRFNDLLSAARSELDEVKRAAMYAECQQLVHTDGGVINFILKKDFTGAEISGDYNPLHFDAAFAARTKFGRLVVQGGLTTGLVHALVAMDMPGPGTVFLSQNWKFTAPVYIGDTITAEAEVLSVHPSKPVTQLRVQIMRHDGTTVLEGEAWCYTA